MAMYTAYDITKAMYTAYDILSNGITTKHI